jgi:hypothetical protein
MSGLLKGSGVPREDAPSKTAETAVEKPPVDLLAGVWRPKPSVASQFALHPETVKRGAMQAAVFNISSEAGLLAYNELLRRSHPKDAPEIQLVTAKETSFENQWSVYCVYEELSYKVLAPTRED